MDSIALWLDALPAGSTLVAFLAATFVLAVTPGPGVVYIVTRTVAQGWAAGLASVGGVALGNLGNAVGASLGLAALFAVSSMAFTVVKFAGAGYLIHLGVQALREREVAAAGEPPTELDRTRIFVDGILVALLNPKTTLFFAALLSPFIQATSSPAVEAIALSVVFVLIAATTDTAYVLLAGRLAAGVRAGKGARTGFRYLVAVVYFSLGFYAAFQVERHPGAQQTP